MLHEMMRQGGVCLHIHVIVRKITSQSTERMNEELVAYERKVRRLAYNKEPYLIDNKSSQHAIILLKYIFETAEDNIQIVAGTLNSSVTNSKAYIQALEAFLKKPDTTVDIIVMESPSRDLCKTEGTLWYHLYNLSPEKKNRVKIKHSDGAKFLRTNQDKKDEKVEVHFTLADSTMFRMETNTDKRSALASFNAPAIVKRMENTFYRVFNDSEKVKRVDLNVEL